MSNVHILNENRSVFNHFIAEIRDVKIQKDPLRFRRNLERIGEMMAFTLSQELSYKSVDVSTPLGIATEQLIKDEKYEAVDLYKRLETQINLINIDF